MDRDTSWICGDPYDRCHCSYIGKAKPPDVCSKQAIKVVLRVLSKSRVSLEHDPDLGLSDGTARSHLIAIGQMNEQDDHSSVGFDASERPNGYYLEYYLAKYGGSIYIYRTDHDGMLQAKADYGERHTLVQAWQVSNGEVQAL